MYYGEFIIQFTSLTGPFLCEQLEEINLERPIHLQIAMLIYILSRSIFTIGNYLIIPFKLKLNWNHLGII